MRGGSAAHATDTITVATAFVDTGATRGNAGVEIAPIEAAHALRQAAVLSTPSGQQGHGSPSDVAGMKSSQGMLDVPAPPGALVIAATTGADRKICAATST